MSRWTVLLAVGLTHALEEEDETLLLQTKSASLLNNQGEAFIPTVLDSEAVYFDTELDTTVTEDDDDDLTNRPDGTPPAPVTGDPDEPCSVITITFAHNKERGKIVVPDECAQKGWTIDPDVQATCEPVRKGKKFPEVCNFPCVQHDVPDEVELLLQEYYRPRPKPVPQPTLIELQARVNHTFEMEKLEALGAFKKYGITKATKGKRDAQYQWAAKAAGKAMLSPDGCKPETNGKKPPRGISCDVCWGSGWWPFPYPCNCGCRGWTQVALLCVQPCREHGEYSHDSGAYCHKPCDRERQIANKVGCGFGHARNCVANSWDCVASVLMKVWAFADVLLAIGTAGAGKAISAACKTAKTAGVKAAMSAMREAMQESVKKISKNLADDAWIDKQLAKKSKDIKENILENGAKLFLLQSLPSDWGNAFLTVASIVDPTGITGVISEFMPKPSCDENSYMDSDMPNEDNSAPECGVTDDCRVSGSGSSGSTWSAQTGACNGAGGYTHCKFAQSKGWRKNEMATYSSGVSKARSFCRQDAAAWGAVGAQSALLWGWQYCFMFFPKGTSCASKVSGKSGYYQEWKGTRNEALKMGGSTANHNYCMIR